MANTPTNPEALPLYMRISEALIRDIHAGRLSDGDRLPPERDMAEQYQTTVTTLRRALAILQQQGLLERIHGSGNYVRHRADVNSVYSMFRLELHAGGGLPTARVIDVIEQNKPGGLPAFGTSARATRIRRLRYLDKTPIAVEEIWLDRDAGAVDQTQLHESPYLYYKKHLGFWISRAQDRVGQAPPPDWAPPEFAPPQGQPTGYIERHSWAQNATAVEFSRTWFDTARAVYVQRLK